MRPLVHLVREEPARLRRSVCGAVVVRTTGTKTGAARGTTRRAECDCRACLAAVLPGSHGGTADDPDSIDVSAARNAVDHYTRELAEPRTIVRGA